MDPLAAAELAGSWAPVLPPLGVDGTLCLERLEREIEALVSAGVRGLVLGGGQSEWVQFDERDFDAGLACLARQASDSQLPYVAGATHMDPARERERVEIASAHGPGAIRVGISSHLASLAETSAPAGLVLDMTRADTAEVDLPGLIEDCPFVVGLSLATHDEPTLEELAAFEDELAVLVPGHFLATGVRHGALGSFSRMALLSPEGAQSWYENLDVDMDSALALELRVQRFFEDWIAPYSTRRGFSAAAVDKLLVEIGGWCPLGTHVLSPDVAIDESEAERLVPLARERLPEFFRS